MNFHLENFELRFPPELLAPGEKMYDNGSIVSSKEVERNLWSLTIVDSEKFEIEVLISPSKVKSYSCDCDDFKSNTYCAHVVAALYFLRILKTKDENVKQTPVVNVPKKISVPNILSQISETDLKNFVRNYAKRNKHFSTAIKANFARYIELENNEHKYEQILNAVIRPATGVDYRISHQTIKQFLQVAEQFDAQFEDAISLKQYTEAFYIIKSLLAKVSYADHWTRSENKEICALHNHLHKQFDFLIRLEIAPELRQLALDFGKDLAGRTYYHLVDPEQNLFHILLPHLQQVSQEEILIDIINRNINSEQNHDRETELYWVQRYYFRNENIGSEVLKVPMLSSHAVYRICKNLEGLSAFEGLKEFIELFRHNGKLRDLFLVKKYLEVLSKLGKNDSLISESIDSLIIYKDLFFYNLMKKYTTGNPEVVFDLVDARLSKKTKVEDHRLYLNILAIENKEKKLIDFLIGSKYSLTLLYEFAEHIDDNTDQLTEVVVQIADLYLEEYLGKESASEMQKLVIFLKNNHWSDASKKLKKHIVNDFSDRKNLVAELKEL